MSLHRALIATALAGALMLPLTAVNAQQATQDEIANTSVPGVCMLSRDAILANSKVGKAASTRLTQLAQQARDPLEARAKQFREKVQGLTEAERVSQQAALQQQAQALQQEAKELDARIRLTRSNVMQRIGTTVNPLVSSIYKQHGCGILLDRNSVLAGNASNDLTAAVIAALDKKMSTIAFNLAPLPKQPAASTP